MTKSKFSYPQAEPFNFVGIEQEFDTAKVAILPVPYSSTTYWDPNTKFGPQALIDASRRIELFDLEFQQDLSQTIGFYTMPELSPSKNTPEETIGLVKEAVQEIIKANKFPLTIGGEHSIALGPIQALAEKYPDLTILQFDAHSDLRDELEGTKYHHGCVMGRVVRDLKLPVTQVGIRSVSEEEIEFIKETNKQNIFYAPDWPVKEIVQTLGKKVYITFDLDVFDPAVLPGTGTPEPGGINWYQALELLKAVGEKCQIVGADIVELSPKPGLPASEFLAAKLAYKLSAYAFLLKPGS